MILSTFLAMPSTPPKRLRTFGNRSREAERRKLQKIAADNSRISQRRRARYNARQSADASTTKHLPIECQHTPLPIRPADYVELERAERIAKKFNKIQQRKDRKKSKDQRRRKAEAGRLQPERVVKRRKEALRLKSLASSKRDLRNGFKRIPWELALKRVLHSPTKH